MKKSKGFTLIELMVTLAIFSIVSILLMAILFQGQVILKKAENRNQIQNEVRNMILNMQKELNGSDEVVINNAYGKFESDEWILDNNSYTARELVRVIKRNEGVSTVYVEVNIEDKHQFIKFDINKDTNNIISNTTKVLLDNIAGSGVDVITVDENDDFITINCNNMVNGSNINELNYLITINKKNETVVDEVIENEGDNNLNTDGGNNNDENNSGDDNFNNGVNSDWYNDGISISLVSENGWQENGVYKENWTIKILNNSGSELWDWELVLKLENGEILNYDNGIVDKLESNKYRIYTNNFSENNIKNSMEKILHGQILGQKIDDISISDVQFRYKKIINPNTEYIKINEYMDLKLEFDSQWDGTSVFRIRLKNNSNTDVKKWGILFDFEKQIKGVSWGLELNNLGGSRYKINNNEGNVITAGSEIIIEFNSESGIVDRNMKKIVFNKLN